MVRKVPSDVMLVAPYIFLYTSGTVEGVEGVEGVMEEADKELEVEIMVLLLY